MKNLKLEELLKDSYYIALTQDKKDEQGIVNVYFNGSVKNIGKYLSFAGAKIDSIKSAILIAAGFLTRDDDKLSKKILEYLIK
jgi:hypothetical protein